MSNKCHIFVIILTLKCNEARLSLLAIRASPCGFARHQRDTLSMAHSFSKITASFAAAIGLLCAGNALAADTAEVTVARVALADVASAKSETSTIDGMVFAGNQRATNLQKTSTAIIVADIASSRKSRVNR